MTVWAADADVVNQAEAMLRAGRFAEAFQLLEPLEERLAGDLRYDYLLARSALEMGQPSRATFIYERILAVEPNYAGVRLEMGRAYLALGDYARAKLEFETLLRFPNLPPDLRQQVLIYAKAAEEQAAGKRTVGFGYLEYGYGYDSNPQSVSSANPITTAAGEPLFIGEERSDQFHNLSVGGELVHALTGRFSAYAGGDARMRGHRDVDTADYGTIDGRVGVGYSEGGSQTRVGVNFGRYYLDHEPTRDNAGLTAEYRTLLNPRNQVSVNVQVSKFEFLPELLREQDYDLLQSTVGWLGVVNEGRGAIGISLLGGIEKARRGRTDGDKPYAGARLTLQNSFTDRVGAFFLGGAQRGKYKDFNVGFGDRRKDTLYDMVAGITWTFAPGWSLRPQLIYLKNDSNLAIFEYEKTEISINLRKDF
ncbi:MAG: tetratricopeptide repeat protein [Burkholderiales bacterium]